MSEANSRLNRIVTKALNTSPISRAIHDKYYNNKSYTYATTPLGDNKGAFVERVITGNDVKKRLVLVLANSDDLLVMSTHHELVHIRQTGIEQEKHFPFSHEISLNDVMARTMIIEAHARAVEVEGSMAGFFTDLSKGKIENIEFYKNYMSNPYTSEFAQVYINALLGTNISAYNMRAGIDQAGIIYMNNFVRRDEKEQDTAMAHARKETIKLFFTKNGANNNPVVDAYIGMNISNYKQGYGRGLSNFMQNMSGIAAFLTNMQKQKKQYPLQDILQTTYDENGPYLSEKDWYEALNARSNDELVQRNIIGSAHAKDYWQVVGNNKRSDSKFGPV